ncbi:peptidase domain-containing ABC transporter [Staphylococcus aureus]|uniref:peptidase domain-containing ABC transporter n=1 Tax=Staphylococcus aureus TaxID=1280 RepID=UPI0020BD5518
MKKKRKVPLLRQMSQTECGITSLSMIFSYYGYENALTELRKDVSGSRSGISMLTLKKIGENYNFDVSPLKIDVTKMTSVESPLILFWENNHFLILEKIEKDHFFIVDPSLGKYVLKKSDVENKYSGYCLLLKPNKYFQPQKKKKKLNFNLFEEFFHHKLGFIMMLVIAVVMQLSIVILPITTKLIIDNSIDANHFWEISNIKVILLLMLVILVIQIVFNYLNSYIINKIQRSVDKVMIPNFVNHLVNLPIKFFNVRSTGDLVLRTNNLEDVRQLVLNQLITGFLNATTLFVVINYMFSQSLILSLSLIIIGLIQMFIIIMGSKSIQPISNLELSYKSEQNAKLSEMIHSINTIKSLNEEETFYRDWKKALSKKIDASYELGKRKMKMDSTLKSLTITVPIIITIVGVILTVSGDMSIGSLFGFLSLSTLFLMPFNNIAESVVNINNTKSILNFVEDVATNEKEENIGHLDKIKDANIKFKNVSFRFDKYSPELIRNVNISIEANSNIAIIGASGSGKSTLLSLLNRVYKPSNGEILIDDENIEKYNIRFLRENIGIVTQEFSIFNKTILENITLNNEKYKEKDVYEALAGAALLEEVMAMPQGINTMLSENGTNISGGQRQRLAIARALIKKPKILILDEATSALDYKNEIEIDKFLKENKATKITTSHSLYNLKRMDEIILICDGEIVLSGKYEDIKNKKEFKQYIGDE